MFRHSETSENDVGSPFIPFHALAGHRPSRRVYHRQKSNPWLTMASDYRCATDECAASTPGDWDSHNAVLALSLRRCRTTAYTSSAVSRFTNMLLSPRPFGSRSVVRLGVICPELRPPLVAIPSVRDTAHTFASYGSRQRDFMGKVHFASSTVHSPWTA